uniref:KIB1-4 beta-propeller domain-containing protein n=1 Tax=Davidia involucrata TaxID=16924 RepID=A0A5B6Z7N6_DAVIN
MNLMNPLSRVGISLPPQCTFTDPYRASSSPKFLRTYFIEKVVLLSSPSYSSSRGDCCFAIALYLQFCKLAIVKPRDDAWSPVEAPHGAFEDVACLDSKFFAINFMGDLLICEFTKNLSHPNQRLCILQGRLLTETPLLRSILLV